MKAAKVWALAVLLLAIVSPVQDARAGTKHPTIFVANDYDVTAYPTGSSGDVAPIALTTDMAAPSGIARDAGGRIYIANTGTNTITVYAANANGNVQPIAVIGGSNTKLTNPGGIALDASGKIYVLNSWRNRKGSITVYPPLATSTGILNEAPVATIAGAKTELDDPAGIALDSRGDIYVASDLGGPAVKHERYGRGKITAYPAGSNGNVAPTTTISGAATGLAHPIGIALDSGGNIYVSNVGIANTTSSLESYPSITVYPAGSNGNAAPIAVITGDNTGLTYPQGIALDSGGNLYAMGYVEDVGYSVNVYPAGSNGNVSPVASIAGADTGLDDPDGIALDSTGKLYVSNSFGGVADDGSVTVYPAGSSGDAAPTNTITSSFTGIDSASGIAVDSTGNIYLANELGNAGDNGSVTIYPAGSYATGSPVATIAGDNTGLSNPLGIAVDSHGNIFVLNIDNSISEYSAGSTGDATPNATINVDRKGSNSPPRMTVDLRGNLYIVNPSTVKCSRRSCEETDPGSVAVYPADSDGNPKPGAVIAGPDTCLESPSAIAVDHSGNIYVTNEGPEQCRCGAGSCGCYSPGPGSVTVYAPGSNGDARPVATISGPNTGLGLPYGITVDSDGNIYVLSDALIQNVTVTQSVGTGAADRQTLPRQGVPKAGGTIEVGEFYEVAGVNAILIFAAGSNGNAPPVGAIDGRFTGLYGPAAIAVGPAGP